MPAPTPKLKAASVVTEVNDILRAATHYLGQDDPRVSRLMHDAESMIKVDPAEAYSVMGCVSQLVGDYEKAIYSIDNAIKLAPSRFGYLLNKCGYLLNLGFFADAQSVFDQVARPELGMFTRAWNHGYVCGAFESMVRHLEKARLMQLDLEGLDIQTAQKAAKVLEAKRVSQSDVGFFLNIAGSVLREHKLFYLGLVPSVHVVDDPDSDWFISISYDVGVPLSKAHELYSKLIDQLVGHAPVAPQILSVSFRSGGEQYERSAA